MTARASDGWKSFFIIMGFLLINASTCAGAVLRDFTISLPLFSAASPWNQKATGAAVHADNDAQILTLHRVLRGDVTNIQPADDPPTTTWPFIDVAYDHYTHPVFRMGAESGSVYMCDYEGSPGGNNPKVPIGDDGASMAPRPAGAIRPSLPTGSGSDGHVTLVDPDARMAYDFWQATTVRDGQCQSRGGGLEGATILEAGAIDYFDLRGTGVNPDGYSSAAAMGVPLLAGLILPEDVASGEISHALHLLIPGPRNLSPDPAEPLASDYFSPASTTETDFYSTRPTALAAGQRIRMKDSLVDEEGEIIDETTLTPITRMFIKAFREYGAYLVDNGSGFTIKAEDMYTAPLNVPDDEVNRLIGESPGAALPAGKTKWQVVMEKLNEELEMIPFAHGPWTEGQDPSTAVITRANFEVVASAPAYPAPVIKANGESDAVTIDASETLELSVSLAPGGFDGSEADWWIAHAPPSADLRTFNISTLSFEPGAAPTHQGPLVELPLVELPGLAGLDAGAHTFYFVVDTVKNGYLDMSNLYYDLAAATVNVSRRRPGGSTGEGKNCPYPPETAAGDPPATIPPFQSTSRAGSTPD
ncbi:MAG: hypothetical protein GY859_01470 [Desulfobacterales bacterium]|nr:hypothetical protein [Desulfobacterales bacterium]